MTNAAISGTSTRIAMHRAVRDLKLKENPPDLLFIEFAINDVYASITPEEAKINLETIINTVYKYSPDTDIVLLFSTDLSHIGTEYNIIKAQKEIADAYKLPYVDMGSEISKNIYKENGGTHPTTVNNGVWAKYFTDIVHPTNEGHKFYSNVITHYLGGVLNKAVGPTAVVASYRPESTLYSIKIDPISVNFEGQIAPEGFSIDGNGFITSKTSGKTLSFTFKGEELHIWGYGQKTGGNVIISVDGGAPVKIELYRNATSYVEQTVATNLSNTEHTVTLTTSASSHGSDIDIRYFMINGADNSNGVTLVK